MVRTTGLVVSKANVIAKLANLFATVERLRKTNCDCRTTVLCTDTTFFICLLCPLRSMSANALRLRLSSLAVYRVERVQVSVKSKKAALVDCSLLWCGHRDLNSDGVTIRPSNVRVCLFRHDRLTFAII